MRIIKKIGIWKILKYAVSQETEFPLSPDFQGPTTESTCHFDDQGITA